MWSVFSLFARSLVCLLVATPLFAVEVSGSLYDPSGKPIVGATVTASGLTTVSDAKGLFSLDLPLGKAILHVEQRRFQPLDQSVVAPEHVSMILTPLPTLSADVVVSAIHADEQVPITKTDLNATDIAKTYYGQDVPLLLTETPSVTTYAEGGVGNSGYSYMTLRGVGPTRINMTFDGVPLTDSEDDAFYFADISDLADAVSDIQIQRGVGTSSVGSPSFGGSINFSSADPKPVGQTNVILGGGSYGARRGSVAWDSGVQGHFALTTRLSLNDTDGYRDNSGIRQHSLFLTGEEFGDNSMWRLSGFSGHEHSELAFFAADAATIAVDPRNNPLSNGDRDSFGQDLAQLQRVQTIGSDSTLTTSVFYSRGYGWYRLWDDETTRTQLGTYRLDGLLYGTMMTVAQNLGRLSAVYGLHLDNFKRIHEFGPLQGPEVYDNYGTKDEESAFAKLTYDYPRLHLYGDAELRTTGFSYHGDVDIPPIRWTFFNPKIGARYDTSQQSSAYASVGISGREPARNDLFQGEDNASFPHDLHAVRPEHLLDFESGMDWHTAKASLHVDVYAMEFHDEIASTGQLSDIGLLLRENVDRSYRRGVELDGKWNLLPRLTIRSTANVSRNRIRDWTQFIDTYDAAGDLIGSTPVQYHNIEPVLTPSVIANLAAEIRPLSYLTTTLGVRYVARSYLDNTDNASFVTPSFVDCSLNVAMSLERWMPRGSPRLVVQVDNLFDNDRIFASGYSYLFFTQNVAGGQTLSGTSYYFPMAPRNVSLRMDFRL